MWQGDRPQVKDCIKADGKTNSETLPVNLEATADCPYIATGEATPSPIPAFSGMGNTSGTARPFRKEGRHGLDQP
ncbi:MAG: hypothetical protein J0I02_04240, partial [Alphaproteobacteria bacterium]|nr:hypothetical protein [Alphaproteobacteria bacterium]